MQRRYDDGAAVRLVLGDESTIVLAPVETGPAPDPPGVAAS
jgi:hypothetical protein